MSLRDLLTFGLGPVTGSVSTVTVTNTVRSTSQRSMARFLTVTASTKRAPAIAGGKRGVAATWITTLLCTPLDPLDSALSSELRQRLALNTPHQLLQTFVEADLDIERGDVLVVGSAEYPIRSCAEWEWRGTTYRHLVIEDLKR